MLIFNQFDIDSLSEFKNAYKEYNIPVRDENYTRDDSDYDYDMGDKGLE